MFKTIQIRGIGMEAKNNLVQQIRIVLSDTPNIWSIITNIMVLDFLYVVNKER